MVRKSAMALAVMVVFNFAVASFAAGPLVVPGPGDAFQVRYANNLNIGDSVVEITNAGSSGGNVCENIYVFDTVEEMVACCSCSGSPNGLRSISVKNNLISNTLTPEIPNAVVIKLVATTPPSSGGCNPLSPAVTSVTRSNTASGMRAWGTTLHALPTTPVTYGVTETEFSPATLRTSELQSIITTCTGIVHNGSGFGICSCGSGE